MIDRYKQIQMMIDGQMMDERERKLGETLIGQLVGVVRLLFLFRQLNYKVRNSSLNLSSPSSCHCKINSFFVANYVTSVLKWLMLLS